MKYNWAVFFFYTLFLITPIPFSTEEILPGIKPSPGKLPCADDGKCLHGICQHGICQCNSTQCTLEKEISYKNFPSNKNRTEDSSCQEHSTYINGRCICEDNYVSYSEKKLCLPKKNYEESCELDTQCITENSKCIENQCACSDAYYFDKETEMCTRGKNFGDKCKNDECYFFDKGHQLNSLICKDEKCTCAVNFNLTSKENNQTCIYSGSPQFYCSSIMAIVLLVITIITIL